MHSAQERRELKRWQGQLISFSPRSGTTVGLSDAHIRAQQITASVQIGERLIRTPVQNHGFGSLASASPLPAETLSVLLTGDDYFEQVSCEGPLALAAAEAFVREVNAVSTAAEAFVREVNAVSTAAEPDPTADLGGVRDAD
jgi:hypothetical protein